MDTKKYIIEIPDNTAWLQWVKVSDKDGHVCFDFKYPEDLTPYIEPDLERVRKEAYEEGHKLGYIAGYEKADKAGAKFYDDGYQRGLKDAWGAARKIVLSREDGGLFGYEERKAVFGCGNYMALKKYSASEAIEKIRQYEQKHEEQIQVGDEVIDSHARIGVCTGFSGSDEIYVMWRDGSSGNWDKRQFDRTGMHYPEIAEVLKKM